MQRLAPLFCISLWLLCLHLASLPAETPSKLRREQHSKEPHGRRRFCDPLFRNQSAGVTGQVNRPCAVSVYFETTSFLSSLFIWELFVKLLPESDAMFILALLLNN